MKLNRRTLIYLLVLILIIIAVVVGVGVIQGNDDDGDSKDDENTKAQDESAEVVTVIVVDDFSDSVSRLALQLDNPDEIFQTTAEEVRALVEQYGEENQPLTEELAAKFAELNDLLGESATSQFQDYVAERGIETDVTSEESKCTINTEGTGIFVAGGTGIFVAGGTGIFVAGGTATHEDVAHGNRVMALLTQLHETYGGPQNIQGVPPVNIEFRTVNIGDFDLTRLVDLLSAEIEATRADHPGGRIVVNMSFGIIPCQAIPSLAIYERLMLEFLEEQDDQDALRALYDTWVAIDAPQRQNQSNTSYDLLICGQATSGESVLCDAEVREHLREGTSDWLYLVGAAGNGPLNQSGGQAFPYYPAAWGEVIAISGTEQDVDFVTTDKIAQWSNFGTIMIPGYWHWIDAALNIDREELGTSFAAPRYSYMMALYLAQSTANVNCPAGGIPGPETPHDWLVDPPVDPNKLPC